MLKTVFVPRNGKYDMVNAMKDLSDCVVVDFRTIRMNGKTPEEIGRYIVDTVVQHDADLLFGQFADKNIPPFIFKKIKRLSPKTKIASWFGDAREDVGELLSNEIADYDIFALSNCDKEQIDMYTYEGAREVVYLPICPLENRAAIKKEKYPHDIVMCMNRSITLPGSVLRQNVAEILTKKYGERFAVYGRGWGSCDVNCSGVVEWQNQINVYASARVCVSVDNAFYDGYYSDRLPTMMLTGTPVVMEHNDARPFLNGHHCLIFQRDNPEGVIDCVETLLNNEELANNIGIYGKNMIRIRYTWHTQIEKFLDRIEMRA